MELQAVLAEVEIISQGDEGTKFYILAEGACDVLVRREDWGSEPRKVLSYALGRYFLEALYLFNWRTRHSIAAQDCLYGQHYGGVMSEKSCFCIA